MEKEAGKTDVPTISFFSPALPRDAARKDDTFQDGGTARLLAASLAASFCMQIPPVLLLQLLLLYLQHATVSFDGTSKPATNQDKCLGLTENHSADCRSERVRFRISFFFFLFLNDWSKTKEILVRKSKSPGLAQFK